MKVDLGSIASTDMSERRVAPGISTSVESASATTFADLRTQVHNFSSRGLLGLAVDPAFPVRPYVYVYYTLDAPIGGVPGPRPFCSLIGRSLRTRCLACR